MINKPKLTKDFEALFFKEKSGHLTEYVYYGDNYFEKLITENKNYYPFYSEAELIKNSIGSINRILGPNKNIVEIGPGSERAINNKTIPILKSLSSVKSYTAIDSHLPYTQKAAQYVHKQTNIKTLALQKSCFDRHNLVSQDNSCLMLLGSTLCNIDDNQVKSFFSEVSRNIQQNNHFIFSIDSNTNPESLKKAYDNMWLEKLAFNTFLFFKNTFNANDFDPEAFKYKYNWCTKKQEIQILLVATKKQTFVWNNQQINIDTGQEFHIITSKKRQVDFFQSILKENNFKLVTTLGETNQNPKMCITKLL